MLLICGFALPICSLVWLLPRTLAPVEHCGESELSLGITFICQCPQFVESFREISVLVRTKSGILVGEGRANEYEAQD